MAVSTMHEIPDHIHERLAKRAIVICNATVSEGMILSLETNIGLGYAGDIGHQLSIGAFSYSGSCVSGIRQIGRYCSIGSRCDFAPSNHPLDRFTTSPLTYDCQSHNYLRGGHNCTVVPWAGQVSEPVTIGNDVWIGSDVTIMPGVHIGDGAVIGARSLVTKDVAPYSIVGGVPAKVLRMRFPDPIIEKMQALQFWKYSPSAFCDLDIANIEPFIHGLEEKIATNAITPYEIGSFIFDLPRP